MSKNERRLKELRKCNGCKRFGGFTPYQCDECKENNYKYHTNKQGGAQS